MNHFDKGFMTGKDLRDAYKYLNMEIITSNDFQRICTTMREDNRVYKSKYDFEYHKTIRLMREHMYGGLLPQ